MSFRGGNCFCGERKSENHPAGRLNLLVFGEEISPPKGPEKKNTGSAATVRPVRPWPYRFLMEKNGVAWILTWLAL